MAKITLDKQEIRLGGENRVKSEIVKVTLDNVKDYNFQISTQLNDYVSLQKSKDYKELTITLLKNPRETEQTRSGTLKLISKEDSSIEAELKVILEHEPDLNRDITTDPSYLEIGGKFENIEKTLKITLQNIQSIEFELSATLQDWITCELAKDYSTLTLRMNENLENVLLDYLILQSNDIENEVVIKRIKIKAIPLINRGELNSTTDSSNTILIPQFWSDWLQIKLNYNENGITEALKFPDFTQSPKSFAMQTDGDSYTGVISYNWATKFLTLEVFDSGGAKIQGVTNITKFPTNLLFAPELSQYGLFYLSNFDSLFFGKVPKSWYNDRLTEAEILSYTKKFILPKE